jgi:hypothetical protein
MKFTDEKILTVEEIIERIKGANDLTSKCRNRISVLKEHFDQLSNNQDENFAIDDHVLWADGIREICADILKDLTEAEDLTFKIEDKIKLYSLDMKKVKEKEKYLKSIGIDKNLVTEEVTA